jgi:hypothetical protein
MEMIRKLKITILACTDYDNYPGWVRCCFYDIYNNLHYIEEKIPVITELDLNKGSEYPQISDIRCKVINWEEDIVTVDISIPFGIEDENGETVFLVYARQIE